MMHVAFRAAQHHATPRQTKASLRFPASSFQLLSHLHSRPWHLTTIAPQCRGVKSKTNFHLEELPKGPLHSQNAIVNSQDEGPAYPPVVQQVWNNMRKYKGCVVLTRVGNFYELYFDHADKYGPLLNLKVAKKKTTAGPVSMAGFPYFQLDRFLKILVQEFDESVAISEEFAHNASGKVKSGGPLFDRKVMRVVTPGTLIDEKFINPYENNYLLAITPTAAESDLEKKETATQSATGADDPLDASRRFGLAWLDLTTGDFYTQTVTAGSLPSALARIGAREVVLDKCVAPVTHRILSGVLDLQRHLITYHQTRDVHLPIAEWTPMLEAPVSPKMQKDFTPEEVVAGSLLLGYANDKLQGVSMKLQPPIRRQKNESMGIDKNSLRGLEVLETSKDGMGGGKGSLLHSIRRTVTKGGTRLLKIWLASPSLSLKTINARLDLCSHFRANRALREEVRSLLRRTHDSQRLVQKFSLGKGDADDLVALKGTIEATIDLVGILPPNSWYDDMLPIQALSGLSGRLSVDGPKALASSIAAAIDEDGLMQTHRIEQSSSADMVTLAQDVLQSEGSEEDLQALSGVVRSKAGSKAIADQEMEETETWIMRKTASPIVTELHVRLLNLYEEKIQLTTQLRSLFGASSLTLRWAPGLGHFCHIKGAKDVRVSLQQSGPARDVKSSKSTRSFHHANWNRLGGQIDQAKQQIRAEEQRIFQALRGQVIINLVQLRRNAAVLDELDIACSFALLAEEQELVRPNVSENLSHNIIGGRHPTVRLGLEEEGRAFVGNDCSVGEKERIWLITGPNMGGKSTFLRQNGLITILAQVGSFVPADHAEIGLVDQIFTRIGSGDDLFRDQSTFMVEMLETAAILNQATPRSFVIMDEIGRGTTPEDGIAIGFACLHHLYYKNQCRTLFATHFHALADMSRDFERLGCYCTDIEEGPSGSFSYIHRLQKGVNRQSHALKVARLAGVPAPAIDIANEVLQRFSQKPFAPSEALVPQITAA